MIRRLRYLAVGLFLFAPCVARCQDGPTTEEALLQAFRDAFFIPQYDSEGNVSYIPAWNLVYSAPPTYYGDNLSLADLFVSGSNFLGLQSLPDPLNNYDLWYILQDLGYGRIDDTDPDFNVHFMWDSPTTPSEAFSTPDFLSSFASVWSDYASSNAVYGDSSLPFGLSQIFSILFPQSISALSNLANGNFGGGGSGGGDSGGVSNIVEILNDQFGLSSGHYTFVSNSFVSVSSSVSSITNQLGSALVLLNGGFSNVVEMLDNHLERSADRAIAFSNQIESAIGLLSGGFSNVVSSLQDIGDRDKERLSAMSGITNKLEAVIDILDTGISNILAATASDFQQASNRNVLVSGITNQLDDVINLLQDMPTNIVDAFSNRFDPTLDKIDLHIRMGPTNIIRILTNHFNRVTNHFDIVSNSLTEISSNVEVVSNQFEMALDLLNQIASNTQQQVQIEILEWMTNDWPSLAFGFPDKLTNAVEDITNNLGVSFYGFHAYSGPLIRYHVPAGEDDVSERWSYMTDDKGRYYLDSYAEEVFDIQEGIKDGSWQFGDVVTYCIQGILDKAQDIKNSLWILNHSIDTNSVDVDISELDALKREVDSFVRGTQGSLESAFYSVELDEGVFGRFKNNFVAIFGTVGKGPPILRAGPGSSNRRTIWSFSVGNQEWNISLDSTLYNSSRRLFRMAASMVWCGLLWLAFRKILIRAIYWLVKCIDWCFQVFGFQIKWLATIEEFLANVAGVGPGGS